MVGAFKWTPLLIPGDVKMVVIEKLTAETARACLPELIVVLEDAVDSGASVGFLPPMAEGEARDYWSGILPDVEAGKRLLFAARVDGKVVGTGQLELVMKPNGIHRAEVQKLLVHRAHRGKGIAGQLLDAIETAAREAKRTLLVLDTVQGDTAERLYRKLGWVEVGMIPHFAMSAKGVLDATVVFYKKL
jgi:acetyltransferase